MIKAIVFDIDDTLVNHTSAIKNASRDFYDKFIADKVTTLEEFQNIWKEEHDKYVEQYLKKVITFQEQRILRLKGVFSRLGEKISNMKAKEYFNYYLNVYEKNWDLFSDVSLTNLSEYKLGIISDGDSEQQRQKLKNNKIFSFFDSIVISGDLNILKPDSGIFREGLRQLNVDTDETLYIGDNYEKDFVGAIKSGLHACLIDRSINKEIQYLEKGYILNSLKLINEIIKDIHKKERNVG